MQIGDDGERRQLSYGMVLEMFFAYGEMRANDGVSKLERKECSW